MTTASAAATSSAVSTFFAPTEPCVSTFIACPSCSAARRSPSAAMNVWAMPVGHDVMPTSTFPVPETDGAIGSGGGAATTPASSASTWSATSPAATATAATVSEMTRAVWRIASAVDTACIGLPAKRAGSMWMSAAMITASAAAIVVRVEPFGDALGALRLDVDVMAHHARLALERLGGEMGVGHARGAGGHRDEAHVVSSCSWPGVIGASRSSTSDATASIRRGSRSDPTCEMATTEQAVARAAASASGQTAQHRRRSCRRPSSHRHRRC